MNKPTRILIVEDRAADVDLARRAMRRILNDCEFQVVEARKDFLQALEVFQPDVILSDYSLPHFNGMEALKLALKYAPLTPLIIWTGSISEDVAVACMKAGANNYVLKENLKRLGPAVAHALEERESQVARWQAENALKEERNLLRTLIDNLPDRIYVMDREGRKTISNTADWKASGGKTMEDVIGKTDFDTYPLELAEEFWRPAKAVIESGQPVINHEEPGLDADGNPVWVLTTKVPLRDSEGNVIGLVGVGRDITERKQAEARINDLLEFNEKILNHSPLGILTYKLTGECVYANGTAASIVGTQAETLQTQNFHTIEAWKKSGLYELVQRAITTQAPVTGDVHHVSTFGKDIWLTVHCVTFKSKNEDHVLLSISDITERKQAEQAVQNSEKRFRALTENGLDNISLLQADGTLIWESPASVRTLNYAPDEFVGRNIFELMHPEDLEWVQGMYIRLIQEPGSRQNAIFRLRHSNGTWRWAEAIATNLLDEPAVHAIVVNYRDITERKLAEEALRESENRLILALSGAQMSVWEWNLQTNQILWSPEIFEITGVKENELGGTFESFTHLIHADDIAHVMAAAQKAMTERTLFAEEFRIIRPDGEVRWLSNLGHAEYDATRAHLRLIGTVQDVTQRKQAEIERQALLEIMQGLANTKDLQEFLKLIHHSIAKVIHAENFFVVLYQPNSGSFEEIYSVDRYDPPQPPAKLEKSVTSYVFRSGEPLLLTQAQFDELAARNEVKLVGTNSASWLGVPLKTSDRTIGVMAVQDYENPNRYSERDKDFMASIATQVAMAIEHKEAGIALRESEEHYRAIFEGVQDAIFVESLDGRILMVNERACEMFGYSRAEFTTKVVADIVPQGSPLMTAEEIDSIEAAAPRETVNRRANGEIFPIEISGRLQVINGEKVLLVVVRDITGRKRAETALMESSIRFRTLFEASPDAILLIDPNDNMSIIDCNTAACQMNGYSREELIGQCIDLLNMTPGNPDERKSYTERIRQQGILRYETTHRRKDGAIIAVDVSTSLIRFGNRDIVLGIDRDITERERAEEALRASETHYRELADSIADILFEMDQELHYTHWNKASEIFSGIPAQDAIGKSVQELFGTSEEQSYRQEIYRSVLKEQQAKTFETVINTRGQKRALEINAYPSTRGVSVVAKDVTERKRAETILQKRLELMEYAVSHTLNELMQRTVDEVSELTGSAIGFFHFVGEDQASLVLQAWSTNALQLCNTPPAEGTHLALDQDGVWAEAVRQRSALIHNDYQSLPRKKGMPDGHVPVLREIVIPVFRNERVMAIMSIGNKPQDYTQYDLEIAERLADYAWDIIERKQMEMTLEAERNQLAQRVEERTADLSRANLNLARALRVKDEFLANMSHELRTPLNAILGLSESLGEQIAGPLNEKQQKYITTISESGHHLLSLINDILDLAKIEAGQITLDINKVDIHSVCQSSLRMIKQLAQKKNQEVSLEIDPGLGLMWADERRLKQMIVNLLGNAVKFTPEYGKLGLEVHGDEANNKVTITVWDNGIGIKDEDLARLFQPFVQLDSGLAREATGTGLGLALVAQMARLHGGSVSAVSEPDKGSRFSIILPWEPALAMDTATRLRNTGKFRAIKLDQTKKPTILLVEDTQDVTMMIRDYLELAGYRMVTAHDGMEGLTQAKLERPDLILMDIQMPGMDGLEATRKLRSEPDFRYTPIIALTALAMPSDRERCLAAGMDEYISKPINLKALAKIIQDCLFNHEESQPQ